MPTVKFFIVISILVSFIYAYQTNKTFKEIGPSQNYWMKSAFLKK